MLQLQASENLVYESISLWLIFPLHIFTKNPYSLAAGVFSEQSPSKRKGSIPPFLPVENYGEFVEKVVRCWGNAGELMGKI